MLNFSSKFVSAKREYSTFNKHERAPVFRKSFYIDSPNKKVEILITGLGFYQLYVNGKDITKGFLAPYISNPDDIVYFDHYDLSPYLTVGENVIGIMLGAGMQNLMTNIWDFCKTRFTSAPKLALTLSIKDGENEDIFEADSFKCTNGPITFNNFRLGVHYDARLEIDGWKNAEFDDTNWNTPINADIPKGVFKICKAEPITIRSEFSPVDIYRDKLAPHFEDEGVWKGVPETLPEGYVDHENGYVYDFGKNSAGVFRLVVKNTLPGQKISLQCCEKKNKDGKISYDNINFFPEGYSQRDIYICRGGEEEIFVPLFVYHGYRYIYVSGIRDDQATQELLTYIEINTKLSDIASFNCSDDIVNKLYAICDNSDKSNFHYFPTDCPHREKNGWTGDAAASSEHMLLTLSVENSYREWMANIRAAQNLEGYIPGIVPTTGWGFAWGNGPCWDRVIFDLPYFTYIYRGSTDMITENAHMMLRYLELLTRVMKDGLIEDWGLGDWCPNVKEEMGEVSLGFCNSVIIMDMCQKAQIMFDAVNLDLHSAFAKSIYAKVRSAARKKYIDLDRMNTEGNTQSGQAMAIFYDLFDECEKKRAAEVLVDIIHKCDDHFYVGYLGARCIFHVLTKYGYADLAYKMITRLDFPSYGFLITLGFTTLPESIKKDYTENRGSHNHHFFGDIKHWFIRTIAGINVNPNKNDPNYIMIKPHFIKTLEFAEASYETPDGKITVKWERCDNKIKLNVSKKGKVEFIVRLPNGFAYEDTAISEGNQTECFEKIIIALN